MSFLFRLNFQGELTAGENLNKTTEREVARAAFPSSPPRDAPTRPDYRAYKAAPLEDGRLLVSTCAGGGRDEYDRAVLRATGCVLEISEMTGELRDLAAAWEVLEGFDIEAGLDTFTHQVAALSICTAPEPFNLFQATLERYGDFYAQVAGAFDEDEVDLYLGEAMDDGRCLDMIRPALGLLPLSRLKNLHVSLGTEHSDYREPILGLAASAPLDLVEEKKRGLSRFFSRQKEETETVSVDFQHHQVHGPHGEGPRALANAITDPMPWPDGLIGLARYQAILQCIDSGESTGRVLTPFEVRPELEELRQAVRRLENLSEELARWH